MPAALNGLALSISEIVILEMVGRWWFLSFRDSRPKKVVYHNKILIYLLAW